ncbi:berberine bridge enzyme-like 21 [Rhododendron vialii]|uniref:berberine bridge enzyme-like 21 n=1 Tax=Rhododendron vialii TaxID=182163 RepID=UPI00266059D3|nr:berberine bridge enzyme-like 21 [Rhododendron vialii]
MNPLISVLFTLLSFQFSLSSAKSPSQTPESFVEAKFTQCVAPNSRSNIIYPKSSPSYSSILQSSIQNLRFNTSKTPKPQYIITARTNSHVKVAIKCSKKHNFEVRIRSGGHDYEGLSYTSQRPFVIIDLANLRKITINAVDESAWVEAGATIGELYYQIAKKDDTLAFPAGVPPTMGVGGHVSGGGMGPLMRKFGLSADNVVDAVLVDVNGRILDRKSMGEDLFWAIRGGGAASFGVVLKWKVKLVRVPPKVTVFSISKNLEQGATKLVYNWQNVADKLHKDLFIRLIIKSGENAQEEETVDAEIKGLFLGRIKRLMPLINSSFPELDLKEQNCREMRWLESILFFNDGYLKNESTDLLLNRNNHGRVFVKSKSDFVTDPISENDLQEMWEEFLTSKGVMIWDPSGGRMNEIPENYSPFPHRAGNLFSIQYYTTWQESKSKVAKKRMDWINNLYNFMGPHVSQNPRAAYLNYRDLDLGRNEYGKESFAAAEAWGRMYFKDNFERLAQIKTVVDPENFFKNEQSIPLI